MRGRLLPFSLWSGLLLCGTLLLFWPAVHCEFLHYDDDIYVTENPGVQRGLTLDSVRWAFGSVHAVNWHPLTWLSHMLDVELFGPRPWGHHLTSVVLHALGAVCLFGCVVSMTGALLPSFVVAALFAVHPLRVESVVWISERKDVLCGLFGFATIWAYSRYAIRGGAARYLLVLTLYALSLLSKPMLVSLPFVLLVLDEWPLGSRVQRPLRRRIVEKVPLLLMAGAVSWLTVFAQDQGPLRSLQEVPLVPRILNAAVSVFTYLFQSVWPVRLGVLYPHPGTGIPVWKGVAALAVLAAAIAATMARRCIPCIRAGWWWYLITLLPVIGIVQVGYQAHADRYTYVPLVGIGLAVVFLLAPLAARSRVLAGLLLALALGSVAALAPLTRAQIAHWQTTESLFRHTLEVTSDNAIAHTELAVLLAAQGQAEESRTHFDAALAIDPSYGPAQSFLGKALTLWGRPAEGEAVLRAALARDPDTPRAHQNLAVALQRQRKWREAAEQYRLALAAEDARDVELVHEAIAETLRMAGDADGARRALEELVREHPQYARGHLLLIGALLKERKYEEARRRAEEAIQCLPRNPDLHYMRGAALYSLGRFADSVEEFESALAIDPDHKEAREGLRTAQPRVQ